MPTPLERKEIAEHASAMVIAAAPGLSPLVQESLQRHLYALLWNLECLVNVVDSALNVDNIAPDYGLLICKTEDWAALPQNDMPDPIGEPVQAALKTLLGNVARSILPLDVKAGTCLQFESQDGLLCCLYRMSDQAIIYEAAGIDLALMSPAPAPAVMH